MRILTRLENRMDCETNIDSIRALEEQIMEYERTVIKLKRARNSLLNVSKLPPEMLGEVFRWNVIREGDFGGLNKRSHNFLTVCHYWFEVASRTSELWSSWGNTTKDWARWCHHHRTAPLDLILSTDYPDKDSDEEDDIDKNLRGAINGRATEDTIRSVHLKTNGSLLINDIITELTVKGEELRSNSMESLVLWNLHSTTLMDVSDFFACYRFPKLQRLELTNCIISLWDHLTSRTSILTTLKLNLADRSYILESTPTTFQLLLILASNPTLQRVALLGSAIPDDGGGESSRVQLHHLKELHLDGNLQRVFNLLNQLDHPRNMDSLTLALHGCDIVDVSRTIGPYIRDYLQRRDRSQDGLNLLVSCAGIYPVPRITFHTGGARGIDFSAPARVELNPFVRVNVVLCRTPRREILERAALEFTTYAPRDDIVHFRMYNKFTIGVDTCTQFPNLRALSFYNISLSAAFPNPNLAGEGKISPSLEHIFLEDMDVDDADWSPLVTFLAHRMSSGNRLDTLVIVPPDYMRPAVMEGIRGMVRELRIEDRRPNGRPIDVVSRSDSEESLSDSDY